MRGAGTLTPVAVATYLGLAACGVILLTEGRHALGVTLLAIDALSCLSFIRWRSSRQDSSRADE